MGGMGEMTNPNIPTNIPSSKWIYNKDQASTTNNQEPTTTTNNQEPSNPNIIYQEQPQNALIRTERAHKEDYQEYDEWHREEKVKGW